ncbi:hypothetical protein LCGC14_0611250 [marine sediment metagenome]|uniref:Uncharacterized protein n=1 Tax=marine sediment metagenome TaxID=412755 RepID=A0A0F9UG46_9ZZZZ
MVDKGKEKKLTLKEQLQKDILGYNQQIVNLAAQTNQVIGQIKEARGILEFIKKEEDG